MPHLTLKLYKGKSESQKQKIAEELVRTLMPLTGNGEESFSVEIEDVEPKDWKKEVYDKEIVPKIDKLYKKPGYKM